MPGALSSLKVVEIASEWAAFCGKTLADLGADTVVVEPPGGHHTRTYEPFLDGERDPNKSLWWWQYNTSKRSVVLDLTTSTGVDAFARLVTDADIVVEGEAPGRLAELGIDHDRFRAERPELIWVSITPYGRVGPRVHEPATDLTILAGGGPVWNCGYDDHSRPPVRGEGGQARHVAGIFGANAVLAAVLRRTQSGVGQHIDVSALAAANVTTEGGSHFYLVAGQEVQRQTGRHATVRPSMDVQVPTADGGWITTGFPPRNPDQFRSLIEWIDGLGLRDEYPEVALLELGIERGGILNSEIGHDPLVTEIAGASRGALTFIASRISGLDFFKGAQERDLPVGYVASIEEAIFNEHLVARGFPTEVEHPELARTITYAGAPFKMHATPWSISRRPPLVGEHTDAVLGDVPK
ncbi:MAG: CaiB/BaiF CoA transferase family protein [Acidimicrobiia bacterium]